MKHEALLPALPHGLREELFSEFKSLTDDFSESRWRAAALGAGRFCEISLSVVAGMCRGQFALNAERTNDFRGSCRKLENDAELPKSFRFILLPTLTSLYEVRNTRNVGHVNSAIDPSFMDGSYVVAGVKWVMAEFIRHFHSLPTANAQSIVDSLSQYVSPLVWSNNDVRRVLQTGLSLDLKIMLLLSAAGGMATRADLFDWLDEGSKQNFNRRIASLHSARMIEAKAFGASIQILPPGNARVATIVRPDVSIAA